MTKLKRMCDEIFVLFNKATKSKIFFLKERWVNLNANLMEFKISLIKSFEFGNETQSSSKFF